MKKFFVTLGLAILVLTGCSQSQTKKTTTASSSSSSSVKKEVKNEEKTTTLVGDIKGTKHRDIIKSKGDKVENLRIEVTADLPQQLGTIAAEKSPEELTAAIQALLEQNEDYKKLKNVPGFSLEYSVTPEKKLLSTSVIDLNQIDTKSLKEISYFKDAGLNDLKNMKADALIKALKLHGMKEEGQEEEKKSSEITWLFLVTFVMSASDKII